MAITWNAAFNATPAGSDDPAQGDDRIRELKTAIQTGSEHEHDWLNTSQANRGWHKTGTAKIYFTAAEPTLRPDNVAALTASDAGRLWMSSATAIPKVRTSGGSWVSCAVSPVATQTIKGVKTFTSGPTFSGTPIFKVAPNFSSGYSVADQTAIKYKILAIGSWNMDAVAGVSVGFLTGATVRSAFVKIEADGTRAYMPLERLSGGEWSGRSSIGKIYLNRATLGIFDNAAYATTSLSRGTIFVTYS